MQIIAAMIISVFQYLINKYIVHIPIYLIDEPNEKKRKV